MNGIDLTLRTLHRGERRLAHELVAVGERHATEHEVHHVATDLALWSREHVRRLTETAAERGVKLGEPPEHSTDGVFATLRKKASEAVVHRPEPGLLLLRDLRELHVAAAENSLHWEMLAQAAQASKDCGLLALASSCHPQTLRQMRWTNTMIKNLSPQILTSL
ncbi:MULTISPECIES: hypothetical protein [Streptomyces]|uniref:Uncharacterized protein n=1 Tax=Streptomyces tendae TaxID=1932 RepID=A0ABW7S3M1_STRTE|nr:MULTISPECIES: hypothetical protein [unclassified Streptomyces]MBQ0963348.1 hypothetical protein [Streptomyces sp. RK74B]MBQ1002761.1 hypothetical protein [Streptomyces sp. RK23]BET52338.1 hypothetical protein RGQ21_73200 [Kitasatospora aureofaciens]